MEKNLNSPKIQIKIFVLSDVERDFRQLHIGIWCNGYNLWRAEDKLDVYQSYSGIKSEAKRLFSVKYIFTIRLLLIVHNSKTLIFYIF